jgi:adenosylhomocysteine nucleosidase
MNSQNNISYIIVSALEDEAIGLEKFAPVVHTGIGKINACIKLYEAIVNYKPDLVINYGTAGGLSDLLGLHKVAHFVQADMDVRGLDFPRGITPLMNEQLPKKQGLVLGTSDSFITNAEKQLEGLGVEIDLVDMEGYALNKVCQHHDVQFEAYKYISDNANENAGSEWQKQIKSGTQLFAELLSRDYGVSCLRKLP